jgi:hypothetical protein
MAALGGSAEDTCSSAVEFSWGTHASVGLLLYKTGNIRKSNGCRDTLGLLVLVRVGREAGDEDIAKFKLIDGVADCAEVCPWLCVWVICVDASTVDDAELDAEPLPSRKQEPVQEDVGDSETDGLKVWDCEGP